MKLRSLLATCRLARGSEELRRSEDENARHGLAEERAEIAAVAGDEVRGTGAERRSEDGPVLLAQLEPRREDRLELLGYDAEELDEAFEAEAGLGGLEVAPGFLDHILRRQEVGALDLPEEPEA